MEDWLIVVRTDGEGIFWAGAKKLSSFDLTFPDFKLTALDLPEKNRQALKEIITKVKEHP